MDAHYNGEKSRLSASAYQGGFGLKNWYFIQESTFMDFQSIIL